MNHCKCNKCGRIIQGQPRRWKFLTQQFGSRGLLKANFVCSKCRHEIRDNPIRWAFTYAKPMRHLKWTIEREMENFENNTYNQPLPQRVETFKHNIHAIMTKRFIMRYEFIVASNKLCAILLKEMPFIGDYELKLNETNPKKEPSETE